jgi:hypothetical protein
MIAGAQANSCQTFVKPLWNQLLTCDLWTGRPDEPLFSHNNPYPATSMAETPRPVVKS